MDRLAEKREYTAKDEKQERNYFIGTRGTGFCSHEIGRVWLIQYQGLL